MPPASAFARDMQRPQVGQNIIARGAAENVGTGFERGKGFNQRDPVNVKLTRAERVFCVFQDAGEIIFSLITTANPPGCFVQGAPGGEATSSAILFR